MVILYIYSTCWLRKPVFYESQHYPNWENGVSQTDLRRQQPLLEIVLGLLHKGWMGEEILRIFSVAGFSSFTSENRQWRCPQGQVVPSTNPSLDRPLQRSTPEYQKLLFLRVRWGGSPAVLAANGCGRKGWKGGWRVTWMLCAHGLLMRKSHRL
jgi:hypothetical protein